jgi:hypothetical protein
MGIVWRMAVLVAAFAMAGPAVAQVRLAQVAGTVTDQSGGVLPGVTITAVHVATGQTRATITGDGGTYVLTALTVGEYEILAELSGFSPLKVTGYTLGIGDSARLDLKLSVATLAETVVVQGEAPLVDPTKSDLTGRIDQVQLKDLPVNGRNWMNFATIAPGVKSDGTGQNEGGNVPTSGLGTDRMSKVSLDGGNVQNLSTQSIDLEVSKEIIGEFEVITNRFDAVMGHAGTTITNAVTKGGADRFSGSAFIYYRDDSLNATDFFTGRVEPYQNRQYGGTLGGPIVKGRTHFFGSYERQEEPKTLSANTGYAVFDAPVASDIKTNLYFVRVDHGLTTNHQLSARYNRYKSRQPNSDVGGAVSISNAITLDYRTDRVNVGLNSVFGPRFVNQFSFTFLDSYRQFNRFTGPPLFELYGQASLDDNQHTFPSVNIGGRTNVGNEKPYFFYVRDDVSYFFEKGGQHNVKVGGEYNHQYIDGIFASNQNGTFFYERDPPNLATCCPGGDQRQWDKSQFPIPARYTQGIGDYVYRAPNRIVSAYFQDDWTVNPRLTLNLGLRYDAEFGSLPTDDSGLASQPFDNDLDNLQPRVGFAWDVMGSGRTVVRGGGGLYVDQVYLNLTFNQTRTNSGRLLAVTTFNTSNDPRFAIDPLGGRTFDDFIGTTGAANVTKFSADAEQPEVWTAAIGLAQQLTPIFAVSADYVHQRSDTMLKSLDTNLFCCRPDGYPIPIRDGTFPELGGAVVGGGRPDPRFNTITTYSFNGRSRYDGLQVAVNKRMSHNYQLGLTYLLSKNKDSGGGANNPFNLDDEYGRSALDQRHRLVVNWVARLPWDLLFSGIGFMASGRALGATTGGIDINGDGSATADRPLCGVDARFNAGCAFLGVPNGERIPRNPLTSDPVARFDMRLSKIVRIRRARIEPSIEAFNIFNRRNYAPNAYNTNLTNPRFGLPGRSQSLQYLPRQIQLAIRMDF